MNTNAGKTTLALYSYVYRLIADHLGDMRYRVVYYSLEMTGEILMAKILSLHIFETYGVELSYKQIMSRQEILSDKHLALVESCEPWLEQFEKQLLIVDKNVSSSGIYASLSEYSKSHGTFIEGEYSDVYEPYIKDELVLIVVDHLGLINLLQGQTKKDAMDLTSKYLLRFRNKCAYSPLVLLQINRGQANMLRVKESRQEIELSDIKDSGGPSEDAEVVLAIFHPWREKMTSHKDYNIRILKNHYRAVQVLKARLGESDKSIGLNFFGSIGLWREMPEPRSLQENDMEQFLHLQPPKKEVEVKPTPVNFKMRF